MEFNPYHIYWSDLNQDAKDSILIYLEIEEQQLPDKYILDEQPITIVNIEELSAKNEL